MILSDSSIQELMDKGDLGIDPLGPQSIQPASVDCCLGDHFLCIDSLTVETLRLDQEIPYKEVNQSSIILAPHSFLLATTVEYIRLPSYLTAFVEGRSSIGRMGLFIQNAGWVDAGFEGRITLELYNANNIPIRLEAGRRVCQLVFCRMDQGAKQPYQGKYQGQRKSVGSLIYRDSL